MKTVIIYTDGACRGNPGPGGWGVLIKFRQRSRELYGGESNTTNNKMELKAAIMALRELKELRDEHNIKWNWVKGHSGDPGNETADMLANRGIDEL